MQENSISSIFMKGSPSRWFFGENEDMKKTVYITSFTFLGILLQFVIHGLLETWYIGLLVNDFAKYSFGFSWAKWFIIHHAGTVIFFAAGVLFGFWQGKFWWHKIYER